MVIHGLYSLTPCGSSFRRRSLAPSRPALYPDQVGLALFTVAALGAGTYVVLRYAWYELPATELTD